MKYPSQTSGNNAHVVAGVLPEEPVGTVRVRPFKLLPGGVQAQEITLSDPNNVAQELLPLEPTIWMYTFDVRQAMEAESAGSFAAAFPRGEEHAVLMRFYDDAGDSWDACKITFGGGEDHIDQLAGPEFLTLADLATQISGETIWTCLTGFNYTDADPNDPAQTADTIEFTPFLLRSGLQVTDEFLGSATVQVFEVDGLSAVMTMSDTALTTTLTNAVGALDTNLVVADTTDIAVSDILAIEDELVSVDTVVDGQNLTVVRGVNSTDAVAHGAGLTLTRSAADDRGVFHVSQVDTSALTIGQDYTLRVSIGYRGQTYSSTHQFQFVENDV